MKIITLNLHKKKKKEIGMNQPASSLTVNSVQIKQRHSLVKDKET